MLTPNVAQHFFPANILSALNHFVAKNVSGATFGSVIATFAMQICALSLRVKQPLTLHEAIEVGMPHARTSSDWMRLSAPRLCKR